MYDELVSLLRRCGKQKCKNCEYEHVLGCVTKINEKAAEAIEAQDRHILTLQCEMMAEAESHNALVERLNKQIEVLSKTENTTRWIPVTERLPEENGRYLVRYVRDIDLEDGSVHSDEVRIMRFVDAQWRFPFICTSYVRKMVTMEKVTHWMPLPDPPKEES